MRIISGKCRATKLYGFDIEDDGKRPTLDRVKESIFNTLQFDMNGAIVLDMFAGTGNLGLEAYSRGAIVDMIEKDNRCIKVINANIKKCHAEVNLICGDAFLEVDNLKKKNKKYDIIFIDPPYHMDMGNKAVLEALNLVADNGVIVYEHAKESEPISVNNYNVKTKIIGTVCVEYIRKC